jgi:hypothetical protein
MMKTGPAAMWANWRALAVALMALGLAAGCGKTNTTESGETHFVSCNTDADCVKVAGAHTCDGGVCGGPVNDGNMPSSKPPACDGGCGDSECATPGTCTLAAACKVIDCGTAVFNDNACVRPSCENDDGCPDDERCAAIWLSRHYQCMQNGASCDCQAGHGLFPLNICSPVALAGTRGTWQRIIVTESSLGDSTTHTINPDGGMTIEQNTLGMAAGSSTAQLTAEDLDLLTRQINGAGLLRLDLANSAECSVTKELDVIVDLQLDVATLSKNVAGCLNPPDNVVSFQTLLDLVRKY